MSTLIPPVRRRPMILALIGMTLAAYAGERRLDLPAWSSVGMGGGGGFFHPSASPHDRDLLFVSSDMGGFYRSTNGGSTWRLLDWRQMEYSRAPVFHPTRPEVVYACPWSGSVLKMSADAGLTWRELDPSPPWKGDELISLAIDELNPALMLLSGAGGLYRSTDGGSRWSRVAGAPAGLFGLHVDLTSPPEARTCLAANVGGVFGSADGGVTWEERSAGLPWRGIRAFAGASDPETGRVAVYVTIESRNIGGALAGGIYRSTNRGRAWTTATGAGLNTALGRQDEYGASDIDQFRFLGVAARRPERVYVTNSGTGYRPPYHYTVYRSDTAGDRWRHSFFNDPRFPENNTQVGWLFHERSRGYGADALGFHVNGGDPDRLMYTNYGEVFVSRDGGATWAQAYSRLAAGQGKAMRGARWTSNGLEDTSCWRYVFDPHDRRRVYIAYTDIGFARSEDRGLTWRLATEGMPWRNTVYDLACDPDRSGVLFAACSDQHDIPHWRHTQGPTAPGGVCRSDDAGATWRAASTGLPAAPATAVVIDPASPADRRTLYAGVYGHGVFRSVDGGRSWSPTSEGIEPAANRQVVALRYGPDGALYCSVAGRRAGRGADANLTGGLFRSTDGAEHWVRISSPDIFRPVDFAVHPAEADTLYVAAMDGLGHTGGLYKTTDGGRTWERLPVPYDPREGSYLEAFSVALRPGAPGIVYLCTNTHGIFLSRDEGRTWRALRGPEAPPFRNCQRIGWDPEDAGSVTVVTFGGGVWRGPDPAR